MRRWPHTEPGDPNAASNIDQYNQYMISHGMNDPAMDGVGLEAHGMQACQAMRNGQSQASLTNQLESKVSIAEAQNIVYAAHRYLCPGVYRRSR